MSPITASVMRSKWFTGKFVSLFDNSVADFTRRRGPLISKAEKAQAASGINVRYDLHGAPAFFSSLFQHFFRFRAVQIRKLALPEGVQNLALAVVSARTNRALPTAAALRAAPRP
jgi:hypothetical protein